MALYEAAKLGDESAVRRLVAANVNVDCTPLGVCDSIAPYHTVTSTLALYKAPGYNSEKPNC